MKRAVVVIPVVVIAILALSGIGQAADLQAGWYANVSRVQIYTYGQYGDAHGVGNAHFYQTPPGQYGPFQVTDGPYHTWSSRYISVPQGFSRAQSEHSLMMPLHLGVSEGTRLAYLIMSWETNYDSDSMNLQVWHTNSAGASARLWTQSLEGPHYGEHYFAVDTVLDGYYSVKVAVVPEPTAFLPLAFGFLFSAIRFRRMSR